MQPQNTKQVKLEKLTGILDRPRLETYLKLSDGWTVPALSQRVDLARFAEKILRNGIAVVAVNAHSIDIGLAAFYCNDLVQHRAYLTHLAVDPKCRSRGLGKALLDYAKKYSSSMGMTSMMLEVYGSNEKAKRFYASCGFIESEMEPGNSELANSSYLVCSL